MKNTYIHNAPFAVKKNVLINLFLLVAISLLSTTVVDQGTEAKKADIDCDGHTGSISVRTGVHYQESSGDRVVDYRNGVSLGYTGTRSADCRWLQFVWDEVIVYKRPAGGGEPVPERKSARIRTTSGSYDTTTDTSNPNYNVDSGSGSNPYYEGRGSNIRTDNSTTIYDRPGSAINAVARADKSDASVTKIENVIHFETFLVCNNKICAKVSWSMTYTWTPGSGGGTESGPTPHIDDPEIPGSLNQRQKDRFKAQYPRSTVPD